MLIRLALVGLLVWYVIGSAVLAASPARAEGGPICADRQELLSALSERYAEVPTALGLASSGNVLEILTSDSGSWTVFMTLPSGLSCLIASGESWTQRPSLVRHSDT